MLFKLNWPSLLAQRKQIGWIFLVEILNKQISIPDQYLPSSIPVTATRSCHLLKLHQFYPRIDGCIQIAIYYYSFLLRTIPLEILNFHWYTQ